MEHPKPDGDRGTAYLPARRAAASQLAAEIARVASSPVIDALLVGSATALAVLDEERQIVAVNGAYVALLGASDPVAALGLRNGEALGCVHVPEGPAGCGTSRACASCGAAIATLAAARGGLGERDCALRIERPGGHEDRVLRVRATSLLVDGERFHAFALTDVTAERRRSALQHVFLHDLANLAEGLRGAACEAEALASEALPAEARLQQDLRHLADRLVREVRLQRSLADGGALPRTAFVPVRAGELVRSLAALAAHHPAAAGKRLEVEAPDDEVQLVTDPLLLEHVLTNLLVNAFEASRPGGLVRLTLAPGEGEIELRVWNAGEIPIAVRSRIFQRYFTTKPGEGRGQGTYATKLFVEECLGGRVAFTSEPGEGTTFEVRLPRARARG